MYLWTFIYLILLFQFSKLTLEFAPKYPGFPSVKFECNTFNWNYGNGVISIKLNRVYFIVCACARFWLRWVCRWPWNQKSLFEHRVSMTAGKFKACLDFGLENKLWGCRQPNTSKNCSGSQNVLLGQFRLGQNSDFQQEVPRALSKAGLGNLRPAGQIRLTKHFYQAHNDSTIHWATLKLITVNGIQWSFDKHCNINKTLFFSGLVEQPQTAKNENLPTLEAIYFWKWCKAKAS